MELLATIFLWIVILGHFAFGYLQCFRWRQVCRRLTNFSDGEVTASAFLGRSIGSYNASIGFGLLLSIWLPDPSRFWVQAVVLALIAVTAVVGWLGTRANSNLILIARLAPALIALVLLLVTS